MSVSDFLPRQGIRAEGQVASMISAHVFCDFCCGARNIATENQLCLNVPAWLGSSACMA
jgi:hypothetical protein